MFADKLCYSLGTVVYSQGVSGESGNVVQEAKTLLVYE